MKHYITMDSKQLGQLDPKLKEVYERVMGTSPHKPSSGIPIKTEHTTPSLTTQPSIPQASTTIPKTPSPTQPPTPKPFQPQPQPTAGQPTVKRQTKMTPVFIAIGSFIFIILYTLIWIKLFKLEVPFLPF